MTPSRTTQRTESVPMRSSMSSVRIAGEYAIQGAWTDEPDWLILGHELCGHAVPGASGSHPEWRPGKKGYDPAWHLQAFEHEDDLRESFGLPRLGEHSPSLKS